MICPHCGAADWKRFGFTPQGRGRNRCRGCDRISIDPSKTRPVPAPIELPPNPSTLDRALALVRAGIFSLDDRGAIWKHIDLDRWGYRKPLDPPRRADRPWGPPAYGYRYINFWIAGHQYGEVAHRLLWAYTFGPIPAGCRIGHVREHGDHALDNLKLATWSSTTWPETDRLRRRRGRGHRPMVRMPRVPRVEHWPFAHETTDLDPLVLRIHASVPRTLPEEVRQEVCQELAVAVLSGDATIADIPALLRDTKTQVYRKLWPYFERLSLDAPIGSDTRTTWAELT